MELAAEGSIGWDHQAGPGGKLICFLALHAASCLLVVSLGGGLWGGELVCQPSSSVGLFYGGAGRNTGSFAAFLKHLPGAMRLLLVRPASLLDGVQEFDQAIRHGPAYNRGSRSRRCGTPGRPRR